MTSVVIVEGHSTYVYCDDLVRGQSVVAADRGSREGQGQRRGGRRRRLGNGTGDRRTAGRAGRTSRRTGPADVGRSRGGQGTGRWRVVSPVRRDRQRRRGDRARGGHRRPGSPAHRGQHGRGRGVRAHVVQEWTSLPGR